MKLFRRRAIARLVPFPAFCAAVLFAAPSAFAAKIPQPLAYPADFIATYCRKDGSALNQTGLDEVFDGNFSTNSFRATSAESYIEVDFTSKITEGNAVYVSTISIGRTGNTYYSLYVSEDGSTWTAKTQMASDVGTIEYRIAARIKKVKYVFETVANTDDELYEIEIKGYESTVPKVVSRSGLAKMYWADGSMTANNGTEGFGGGTGIGSLFNGNFTDSVYIGPNGRLNNNGFCMVDFTTDKPGGWFITEIKTGSLTTHMYSLYYSIDGSTWSPVDGALNVGVVGQKTFNVNDTAKYVKCVFNQIGQWTPAFNELQVWGMDPDDVPCTHPSYTPWVPVEGSATCLENGIDEQFCTVCGERVTRESTTLQMLGHDYVGTLVRPGRFKTFGSGSISCSRCDFLVDCPEPVNLITNQVNGQWIGGIKTEGIINFTDVSVSSTGDTGWGIRPGHLIGNNWTWAWNNYWYSAGSDASPCVDYEFGTEIDLVYIDVSLQNSNHSTRFFSVDDATGTETQLTRFFVTRTDIETGDKYHIWRAPEDAPYEDIYGDGEFNELRVVADSGIPARKHDAEGNEIPDNPNTTDRDEGANGDNQYQRFTVRFLEQPVKHLRIRQFTSSGNVMKPMFISELHPWGTVKGAGDLKGEKTTLFILR